MSLGTLVLMGSGETAPTMVATHRRALSDTKHVTMLDTPYGFQENADELTEKISAFFRTSLGVATEQIELRSGDVSDRQRLEAVSAVRRAEYLFAGPGSPTYALDVWRSTGVAAALRAALADGATVVLASAAALTAGTRTIPVYEIYKVGQTPQWAEGVDLTSQFDLPMIVVPHWDNREGGTHDTSRCYIGESRLSMLEAELAREEGETAARHSGGIVGVDEHTAATFDFEAETMEVSGKSGVTLRGREELRVPAGETVPIDVVRSVLDSGRRVMVPSPKPPLALSTDRDSVARLRSFLMAGDVGGAVDAIFAEAPTSPAVGPMIVELGRVARHGVADPRQRVAGFVHLLLELRATSREAGDYPTSDRIRNGLVELGIEVRDTPTGSEWDLTDRPLADG